MSSKSGSPFTAAAVREGVERNEFRVDYQSVVELETGVLVGAEAIVRWDHPKLGELTTESFIELAEARESLTALGWWVLEVASNDAAGWPAGPRGPLRVSVNCSILQLSWDNLFDAVRRALEGSGLAAARLVLEVSETDSFEELDVASSALLSLRGLGVRISLDDLGGGRSSLQSLVRLPIDEVKIDPAFVAGVVDNPRSAAVVRGLLAMTKSMSVVAVADGVETHDEATWFARARCELGQGIYFARPMKSDEFVASLGDPPIETGAHPHDLVFEAGSQSTVVQLAGGAGEATSAATRREFERVAERFIEFSNSIERMSTQGAPLPEVCRVLELALQEVIGALDSALVAIAIEVRDGSGAPQSSTRRPKSVR